MTRVALTASMLALVLAGCGGDGGGGAPRSSAPAPAEAEAPKAATVQIKTFQFQPDPIEVKAGQKVTFVNLDGAPHTVTAGTRAKPEPKKFDSSLDQDEKFEFTFDKPGEYEYFCSLHSGDGMVGKVIVG